MLEHQSFRANSVQFDIRDRHALLQTSPRDQTTVTVKSVINEIAYDTDADGRPQHMAGARAKFRN